MFGFLEIDRFVETLPAVGLGLVLLVAAVHLLRLYAALSRRLASHLLASDARGLLRTPDMTRALRRRALKIYASVVTGIGRLLIAIWGLTTKGYSGR